MEGSEGSKPIKIISRREANMRFLQFLHRAKEEFNKQWDNRVESDVKWSDFDIKRTLGTGSFGRVMLARYKPTQSKKFYAIKVLDKKQIIKQKQVPHLLNEKKILECVSFPFVVRQAFAFKDNTYCYIGLEFVAGGEMFHHLQESKKFDEPRARFYASQVVLAFEYLHYMDLIYRDLKPENLLIDYKGYVKVTDFGFCKRISGRAWTMCGTPAYLAPEIILSKGYSKAVDWWSFGVLLYEMAAGHPPFMAKKHMQMYEKIVQGEYQVPEHFSAELRDLVSNLLQVDVTRRFGALRRGVQDIKNHMFFAPVDYIATYQKKLRAPMVPEIKGEGDDGNFEKYDEPPLEQASQCLYEEEFKEF
ncbi:cAMP-dependent protein kinase catalytic subunit beta-like isoform X2 [Convolutriloba macropyga]|uniref:cAMP-dependent protein kinase catalytic subunit beta-like isoform X2 n=2 Tax=Convolutriloba macropyga TaxID=536237 RepID=UPI003F51F87A